MLAALLAVSMAVPSFQAAIVPKSGLQITKTARIKPGSYRFASKGLEPKDAAIVIRGNDIVVDFSGVILEGTPQSIEPDLRAGLGVYVEGKNVTIKNAHIRGYKVALMSKNSPGLRILDSNFSYNWKQHLNSTPEREDGGDWMSYHQNEKDEWLRYGAGMYLRNCKNFEVKGCRVNGGQNALMMTSCDEGKIWNNDFSFNSSIGIGMYRSSNNKIMHNKIDWCVRGYSHGVYNRGQDSAGILVYEQSHKNVFAYNSATHGGDGFFLWAGQTTMDTGQGGCNDNVLYGNDLSHSPANAIEATFSRNVFANNLLIDCWHGVWGGYSYETQILGNTFGLNGESIAIEHGQKNRIVNNSFFGDTVAIYLWQNAGPPDPNWGYPKHRDTRNMGTVIEANYFDQITDVAFELGAGTDIRVLENVVNNVKVAARFRGALDNIAFKSNHFVTDEAPVEHPGVSMDGNTVRPLQRLWLKPWMTRGGNANTANEPKGSEYFGMFRTGWSPIRTAKDASPELLKYQVAPMPGGRSAFLKPGTLRGRRMMIIDEWGPYDFKRPLLRLLGSETMPMPGDKFEGRMVGPTETVLTFEVMGPPGKWRVVESAGVASYSKKSGNVGDLIQATYGHGAATNIKLDLEFVGEAIVDHRGIVTPKGKAVRFGWSKFESPIDWNVRWYAWDKTTVADPKAKMPTPGSLLSKTELRTPIAETRTTKLDFVTGGSPFKGVPNDHFITFADGAFEIEPGTYEIAATADDGIRLWLDDQLIVDEWHWQGPTRFAKTVKLGGKHRLRVEHYEIDGYTALKVEVAPKR